MAIRRRFEVVSSLYLSSDDVKEGRIRRRWSGVDTPDFVYEPIDLVFHVGSVISVRRCLVEELELGAPLIEQSHQVTPQSVPDPWPALCRLRKPTGTNEQNQNHKIALSFWPTEFHFWCNM